MAKKDSDCDDFFYAFYVRKNGNEIIKYIGRTISQMAHERISQHKNKILRIKNGEKTSKVFVKYGNYSEGQKSAHLAIHHIESLLIMGNLDNKFFNCKCTNDIIMPAKKRYLIKNMGSVGPIYKNIAYGLMVGNLIWPNQKRK